MFFAHRVEHLYQGINKHRLELAPTQTLELSSNLSNRIRRPLSRRSHCSKTRKECTSPRQTCCIPDWVLNPLPDHTYHTETMSIFQVSSARATRCHFHKTVRRLNQRLKHITHSPSRFAASGRLEWSQRSLSQSRSALPPP